MLWMTVSKICWTYAIHFIIKSERKWEKNVSTVPSKVRLIDSLCWRWLAESEQTCFMFVYRIARSTKKWCLRYGRVWLAWVSPWFLIQCGLDRSTAQSYLTVIFPDHVPDHLGILVFPAPPGAVCSITHKQQIKQVEWDTHEITTTAAQTQEH